MNEHILRWNIEESDGRLQVCKGDHDKVLGCQFEPLTLADIGLMRKQIVELQQTVTEKTDKVNALWIENQTLLKQINEAQQQVEALYERHKHLDAFLSDESLPPIGKTGSAILCELWGFVKRAANGEAS